MKNNKNTIYFRIGTFVVTGLILIIIGVVIFGSQKLFEKLIYAETYFKESVQGLTEGSQVKYLGMEIGFVKEINSIENVYPQAQEIIDRNNAHYIYVKIAIYPKFFTSKHGEDADSRIKKLINSGLIIKLAPLGLTGNSYLELNFNRKQHEDFKLNWDPVYYYIPSSTSTLAYFSDNARAILNELKQVNFKNIFENANKMITSVSNVADNASSLTTQIEKQFIYSIEILNKNLSNLSSLTEQLKLQPSRIFSNPPTKLDVKNL